MQCREQMPRRIARLGLAAQKNVVQAILARHHGVSTGVALVLGRHGCDENKTKQRGHART